MRGIKMSEYDGGQSRNFLSKSPVNTVIIAINVIVFVLFELIGSTEDVVFMLNHGASNWVSVFEDKEYYRLLTAAFLHFGVGHLVSNMIVLVALGESLEEALGSVKYAILYVIAILGPNLISCMWDRYYQLPNVSAGASGAVFAVAGGVVYLLLVNKGQVGDLGFGRIALFVAFSLYSGFRGTNIDNVAHVSGLIIGFLLTIILYRKKTPENRYEYYF